jgi:hypothetical protein
MSWVPSGRAAEAVLAMRISADDVNRYREMYSCCTCTS